MIIDMHCDTLCEIRNLRKKGTACRLRSSREICCSLENLKKGSYTLQNFAVYIDLKEYPDPYGNAMELVQIFEEEMKANEDQVVQVRTVKEMEEARKNNKIAALLTLEEGGMCCGDIQKLEAFYEKGARMMTLLWNYQNELGHPAALSPERENEHQKRTCGLTKKGFEFLTAMESMGMIVDVSHLSDDGFYDVYENTRLPFVASHSNARALCGHKRNLTDRMLQLFGERGCVAGLNYFPKFLADEPEKELCLEQIAKHAVHMIDCGGRECIGLGSDFDGFSGDGRPENAAQMDDVIWVFHKAGISDDTIDQILYGNVMRLYRELMH